MDFIAIVYDRAAKELKILKHPYENNAIAFCEGYKSEDKEWCVVQGAIIIEGSYKSLSRSKLTDNGSETEGSKPCDPPCTPDNRCSCCAKGMVSYGF